MRYTFPAVKFISNCICEQLKHIQSEADEIRWEIDKAPFNVDRVAEELVDIWWSCETGLRIVEKDFGYTLASNFLPAISGLPLYEQIKRILLLCENIPISMVSDTVYRLELIKQQVNVALDWLDDTGITKSAVIDFVVNKNRDRGYLL